MPATAAQLEANRANAAFSTGPRTTEGKARSAQNATRHGLTSATPLILPGEEPDYEDLVTGLTNQILPRGPAEQLVFSRLVHAAWMIHRCDRIEAELGAELGRDPLASAEPNEANRAAALERYRTRADRTIFRCFKELRVLQNERAAREAAALQNYPLPAAKIDDIPSMASLQNVAKQTQPPTPQDASRSFFKTVDERFLPEPTPAAAPEIAEAGKIPNEPTPAATTPEPPAGTFRRDGPKVGRNEPCPCGSNRKYKRCCGL